MGVAPPATVAVPPPTGKTATVMPTSKTIPISTTPVPVRTIKHDGLAEVLKEQQGKIVVLNFWRLDCPACLSEIPELIELRKEYEKDGVVVIGLNLDAPEDPLTRDKAQAFLRGVQVNYTQLATASTKDLQELLAGWEFSGLPQTFLYDRAGKRAKHIEGNYPKEIRKGIEELLKQK
jgi:thiol-disulfide isomerase/thioredoxin